MSGTTWYVVIGLVIALLSIVVGVAMHASGGWRSLTSGTVVYTAVVLAMAAVAALVILTVRSVSG